MLKKIKYEGPGFVSESAIKFIAPDDIVVPPDTGENVPSSISINCGSISPIQNGYFFLFVPAQEFEGVILPLFLPAIPSNQIVFEARNHLGCLIPAGAFLGTGYIVKPLKAFRS